jgi:hypothetical protein
MMMGSNLLFSLASSTRPNFLKNNVGWSKNVAIFLEFVKVTHISMG